MSKLDFKVVLNQNYIFFNYFVFQNEFRKHQSKKFDLTFLPTSLQAYYFNGLLVKVKT